MKPRILIYDIETAPIIGTVWRKYEADIVWNIQDWYMLCFAYRWLGERHTYVIAQPDFRGYKAGSDDDKAVVEALWRLYNEADVVVAHNGNSFDQKKSQARMVYHGFPPPSPYRQVDTKLVAKRYFNFTSNKLDDLGEHFGLGRKHKTDKDLWRDCMAGDKQAWEYMKKYNKQDVVLLEKVYLKLRPWMDNHPIMGMYGGNMSACPKCGVGTMHNKGRQIGRGVTYQRWQCQNPKCGAYSRSRLADKGMEKPEYV